MNNQYLVNLLSRSDPNDNTQFGYRLMGGGFIGNRFAFLRQASSSSPFGNVYVEMVASDNGLPPLPAIGSFRLTYRPGSDTWDFYFEQGSTPKDPLSVTSLVGSAPAGVFSQQILPFLSLESQTTGHAYFDNVYISLGSGPTEVSGVLPADTTWRAADGPFVITGGVEVPANGTLTIEPGVRVIYKTTSGIVVRGRLVAEGTTEAPIVFTSYTVGTSSGATMLKFEGANLSQSSVRNCSFSDAARGLQVGDGGEFDPRPPCTGVLLVADSSFERAEVRTAGYDSSGRLSLVGCTVDAATVIGEYARSEPIDLVDTVLRNAVVNADAYNKGISLTGCYAEATEFRIGCCGGTLVIDDTEFVSSSFVDGYGQPIAGPLVIRSSVLTSTTINLPAAELTLTDSLVDFSGGGSTLFRVGSATISSSAFVGNGTGVGIQITGDLGYQTNGSLRMTNSRVMDFEVGVRISGGAASTVSAGNVFLRNSIYHVQNWNYDPVAATGNHWGTSDLTQISAKVFDHADDIQYGVVDVSGPVADAPSSVTFSGLEQTYDGTPRTVTVTTLPSRLHATLTYGGVGTAPTAAGSYAVVATIQHPKLGETATATLVVNKAIPELTWNNPVGIVYGTPLSETELNATANVPGAITYTPAAGTLVAAGSRSLTASFVPSDPTNYATAEKSVTLAVAKATPVVVWGAPAAITYGTPLSAAQLNAAADIEGTWTYSPAIGQVLSAGQYALQAVFTPDDPDNFQSANATVSLDVNKATATVSLGRLLQLYDGIAKPVEVTTSPQGLPVVITYDGSSVAPTAPGAYQVEVVISDPNHVGSGSGQLTIRQVLVETASSTVDAGSDLVLRAATSESGASFQWQKRDPGDGTWIDIPDATASSLDLRSVQTFNGGEYRVAIDVNGTRIASDAITITVNAGATSGAVLKNLSARAMCRDGDGVLIPGFVVQGTGEKHLLVRAVGPTLGMSPFGVSGVLSNPRMALKKFEPTSGTYTNIAANDDWGSATNSAEIVALSGAMGAFSLRHANEAALAEHFSGGQYTVVTDDVQGASGIALMEVYDVGTDGDECRLVNFSNRGYAGSGAQVMILGFVVGSEAPMKVLIRVVGPTLSRPPYNVSGTMIDPKLALYRSEPGGLSSLIHTNDNWNSGPNPAEVRETAHALGAFALDEASKDSAIVLTLAPGIYTVHAGGAGEGQEGIVLAEVYVSP